MHLTPPHRAEREKNICSLNGPSQAVRKENSCPGPAIAVLRASDWQFGPCSLATAVLPLSVGHSHTMPPKPAGLPYASRDLFNPGVRKEAEPVVPVVAEVVKKKRGRPKGSKNKPKPAKAGDNASTSAAASAAAQAPEDGVQAVPASAEEATADELVDEGCEQAELQTPRSEEPSQQPATDTPEAKRARTAEEKLKHNAEVTEIRSVARWWTRSSRSTCLEGDAVTRLRRRRKKNLGACDIPQQVVARRAISNNHFRGGHRIRVLRRSPPAADC